MDAREILFRGKRLDNGKWVEGDLSRCVVVGETHMLRIEENLSTTTHRIDPETVCQYTGLTDKNGRKIFEGDIVRDCSMYLVHKSYAERGLETEEECESFRECGPMSAVLFCTEDVGSCGCCYPSFEGTGFKAEDVCLSTCEVIGNIFDNPELIGG